MTVYEEFHNERIRAHRKHGANSLESARGKAELMLPILVEEIGEIAHCLTYDADPAKLREELVQGGAVIAAWIDGLDGKGFIG